LLFLLVMSIVEWHRNRFTGGDSMKDKRKTKAQSILDMEKEKDRESRGVTMEGGEQMEKRDAVKTTAPLHFIAQGVIPAFIVTIAVLAILDIKGVFEPPLLLFILNTLFISVMSFVVASISARNYLKRGSLSFLLLGCGVLVLGSGGLVAGWLIGPPGGPNVNVTIYDTGALLGAVFHATGAIFASAGVTSDRILVLKRKSTVILAYPGVLAFMALLTIASLRGAIPPYIIQGIGPTLLGRAVLGTAVALFGISSLLFMRLYFKSKETFQYWYSLALALIAVGLSAVFLQKAVGSPIGWAGRSAQYLGGIYLLIAVLITYMEGRLRISEEKLRSVFASSPDAITVINLNGNILECNQSALDIRGCSSKDEVLGKNAFEFIAKKDHERAVESLKKTLEQGSVKDIEYTFLTKDGCEFPAELSASVTKDAYGNPTGFVVIARDITEHKRAEEEQERLLAELEAKNKELESFVYTVSHDLKAPLISLNGFSSALQEEFHHQLGEEGKHYVERIQANVAHMDALIMHLLDLSRIGRVVGPIEEIDVVTLLREIQEELAVELEEAGAELVVQEPLPIVRADRSRMHQVFANLIDNAVKFRSEERPLRIEVGCQKERGFYRFHVADNGIGIAPQYHQQIFAPFRQLDPEAQGVGMGLALVKKIVEHHSGRVWVESEEGEGATLYFTLPESAELKRSAETSASLRAGPQAEGSAEPLNRSQKPKG